MHMWEKGENLILWTRLRERSAGRWITSAAGLRMEG